MDRKESLIFCQPKRNMKKKIEEKTACFTRLLTSHILKSQSSISIKARNYIDFFTLMKVDETITSREEIPTDTVA